MVWRKAVAPKSCCGARITGSAQRCFPRVWALTVSVLHQSELDKSRAVAHPGAVRRRSTWSLSVALALIAATPGAATAQSTSPPTCASLDAQGARFAGLPARVLVGAQERFAIQETGDFEAVGPFQVTMRVDRGRPFFSGPVRTFRELFLRFEFRDRSARITAVGVVEDPDGNRCQVSLSTRVRAIRRVYFPGLCFEYRYRPGRIIVACGDGGFILQRMRWRGWNRRVVRGRGIARVNDCTPYCAAGTIRRVPVRVRLAGRKRCAAQNRYVYTRLRYRFTRRPRNITRTAGAFPFPCR